DPMFSATSSDSQISSDFRFADIVASAVFSRDPIAAIQSTLHVVADGLTYCGYHDSARISDFVGSTITQAIGTYKCD
ncbi:6963_t:CDS:1, partial [Paraglomus occultum]